MVKLKFRHAIVGVDVCAVSLDWWSGDWLKWSIFV